MSNARNATWLPSIVQKYLVYTGKCFRHCTQPTSFELVHSDEDHFVGAYVCPGGAVSQVVLFTLRTDSEWFQRFLELQLGKGFLNPRDIRHASRYGWELGGDAAEEIRERLGESAGIIETYWTRYPKTDSEKKLRAFLCLDKWLGRGCRRLFIQSIESQQRLCPNCRS